MGSHSVRSAFGAVRNPLARDRVAGGSSGGSAAAVADLQAAASLGTDTGGSIRQPAAHCGLVGLKPTWGRVSRYGAIAYASSLDQIGPIARTAEDAALLLEIIAGHDPADMTSLDAPSEPWLEATRRADRLEGLRIGIPAELCGAGNAPGVKARVDEALGRLEGLGAELVPVTLPHVPHAIATYYLIAMAEASSNLARFDGLRYGHRASGALELEALIEKTRAEGFGLEVKRRILLGTFALSAGYHDAFYGRAQAVRGRIAADLEAAFARCDLIASPTSPITAPRLADCLARDADPLAVYLADIDTVLANLAGAPAISFPIGCDDGGLPVGLQLIGPRLGEGRLLEVAAAFGRHFPFEYSLDEGESA
jgi:aspartyl-tRNA(Asn)/glutamyl-tRNA(Gln) amidotransferase subunit A